jgi:hypothetical protein
MKNSEESHAVEGKTWQERLERFRNLSFYDLYEFKYLKKEDENKGSKNNSSSVYK